MFRRGVAAGLALLAGAAGLMAGPRFSVSFPKERSAAPLDGSRLGAI